MAMGKIEIPDSISIPSMVLIYVLSIICLIFLIVGILYLYMLQKFYINGVSLLNTHNGKVLYGSLVASFICFAAAACTNNRSPVSLNFMLLAVIAIIIAIAYMRKIQRHAVLAYLLPNGTMSLTGPNGHPTHLAHLQIHKTMQGLSMAIVIIAIATWFFGMYIAVGPSKGSFAKKAPSAAEETNPMFF